MIDFIYIIQVYSYLHCNNGYDKMTYVVWQYDTDIMTWQDDSVAEEEREKREGEGGEERDRGRDRDRAGDEVWIDIHSRYEIDRIIVIDQDRSDDRSG